MLSLRAARVSSICCLPLIAGSLVGCADDHPTASSDLGAAQGMGGDGTGGGGQGGGGKAGNAGAAAGGNGTAGNGPAGNGGAPAGAAGTSGAGGASIGPAPVVLGSAGKFVMLAESAISSVPTSAITGDVGLSPMASSFITGFPLTKAGVHWTTPEVIGSVFGADNDAPTPANLTAAIGDMMTAYSDAAGRPTPDFLNVGDGAIGGLTLTPGLYNWTSAVTIPSEVTIAGAADDRWIFQVNGDLTMSSAKHVILSGGARAKNIVWQVTGTVGFGTGSHFEGVVLSKTGVTLETGASINGRLFAQTMIAIDASTVTAPSP